MNKKLITLLLCLAIVTPALATKGSLPQKGGSPPPPIQVPDNLPRPPSSTGSGSTPTSNPGPLPFPKPASKLFEEAYKSKFPQPTDEQKAFQQIVSSNCPALDSKTKDHKKVVNSLKAFAYCIEDLSSVSAHYDSQTEVLQILQDILNGPDKRTLLTQNDPPKSNKFASKVLRRKI